MRRTRILSTFAVAFALTAPLVAAGAGDGDGTARAAPLPSAPVLSAQTAGTFLETFDLDPAAPTNFSDTSFADRWHVTQIVTDYTAWADGDPVDAQHGADCGAPPDTHRADTWDEFVYVCKNHLMTARATPAYAATYLMPLAEVDLSGPEAVISWDVSTLSMSQRDWIDLWVTPMDDVLMVPIDDWGPTLQGNPRNGIHVRNGNGSERWTIQVLEDFEVVDTVELFVRQDFEFSARKRTTMTLRIFPDHLEFTMDEDVGTVTLPVGPGFDRGVIQWAQHAYNPTKDNAGVPATWHWDNFAFEPALPLEANRVAPVRSVANRGETRDLTFERAAVDGDLLLFDAVCKVELDFGSGFQPVAKQPSSKGNSVVEAQSSYRVPVPVGATGVRVRFAGDGWWDGWPCVVENGIVVNQSASEEAPALPDFDGDGAMEPAVFRPSNGYWYVPGQPNTRVGASGDVPVAAAYDGDGVLERAVWRPSTGNWYVEGQSAVRWGRADDVPVPADFDGDGAADLAVYRPSNGTWYVQGETPVSYGLPTDVPVPADFDGDGAADLAVFRPSNGTWYVQGQSSLAWGASGDIPVPGDYDGDGVAEAAVWRPSTGDWWVHFSGPVRWGVNGDVPMPADYDGDGALDLAVFRPSNGRWYVEGAGGAVQWGLADDIPVPTPIGAR